MALLLERIDNSYILNKVSKFFIVIYLFIVNCLVNNNENLSTLASFYIPKRD